MLTGDEAADFAELMRLCNHELKAAINHRAGGRVSFAEACEQAAEKYRMIAARLSLDIERIKASVLRAAEELDNFTGMSRQTSLAHEIAERIRNVVSEPGAEHEPTYCPVG